MPDILKTVGRYEILREVGRGGMALVYLARQTDLDRFVALKELAAFHASDPALAQRFLRESRVAGSLSHPNIVTVHDYFEHDGTPYIAMEYVERGSLRPFVGDMTLAQIGGVLEGLLAGLAHAEQHAIVHRDLKPENLMVTSDGRVKIADFGIAKATNQLQTGAFLTATGTTVGTPSYMAPEQAMAQELGPWTDLYSVGCMAFEMFTGSVPFHDSDAPMAILLRHVNEQIPPVSSIDKSVDDEISDWVEQLLVKDPKQRTRSASAAWDDFEEIIIGLLGPRWRRSARLLVRSEQDDTPKPLTPAPFEGGTSGTPASDEFESYAWGEPMADVPPGPATPPPTDVPPGPLEPGPIDVPTGPPTPPPLEPVAKSGFVTFGAPEAPVEEPAAPVGQPASEAAGPAAPVAEPAEPPAAEAAGPAAPVADPAAPVEQPAAEPAAPEAPLAPAAAPAASVPVDEPAAPTDDAASLPVDEPVQPPGAREPEGGEDSGFVTFGAREAPSPQKPPAAPQPEPPEEIIGAHGGGGAPPRFETYVAPPPLRPPTAEPPPEHEPGPVREPQPVREPEPEPAAAGTTIMPESLRRAPEPDRAPGEPRERRSRAFPIALGSALVLAVVAGVALGGSDGGGGDGESSSAPVTPVSAGAVQLKVPESYAEMASAPALPGLDLNESASYAPGGEDGGRAVTMGQAEADDATLLPPQFQKALGLAAGQVPERTPVNLGPDGLQAWRYEGLKPAGSSRRATVYASPTSEGVATVACLAPPADAAAFKSECEGIANTLQIASGRPLRVGPDPAYAKTLSSTFGTLERRVAKGRDDLARDGTTFRAQAAAARDIQQAYADAAKRLGATETGPTETPINAAIVERLGAAAAAWRRAASEAAAKDKRGFARSAAGIERTRADLARTLRKLEDVGYTLSS